MTLVIKAPNGATVQFPDGTDDATINKVMAENFPVDTVTDAAKGFDAGVAKGTASLLGSVGDLTNLGAKGIRAASDYISDKVGLPRYEPPQEKGPIASFLDKIPTSASMQKEIQDRYYGGEAPYEPQTTTGKYARSIGETAPGALAGPGGLVAKGVSAVGSGALSEAAGQLTEGTPFEPYARAGGAFVGGMTPYAGGRVITPNPATPARQRLVDELRDEGVTSLTAGQATGNKRLQYMESVTSTAPLGGGAAERIQEEGQRQFTRAALRRAGIEGEEAAPEVLAANQDRLGGTFRALSARNNLVPDNQFVNDIVAAARNYRRVPDSQQRAMVQGYIDDIIEHVNNGFMPGPYYQEMRSRLSKQANGLRQSDPTLSEALRDMRNALDDAMTRSIPQGSQDANLWAQTRREYGAQKVLEKTASRAGEATAEGQIVPANLRNTVAAENRGAYARGEGDFSGLARAGAGVMAPLPNSGTGQRNIIWDVLNGATLGVMPAVTGRVMMNPVTQRYLSNQALTEALRAEPARRRALYMALMEAGRSKLLEQPRQQPE
jgi:hypothetical protein